MPSDYRKQAENLLFMLNEVFSGQRAELIETALRQAADDARKEERDACAALIEGWTVAQKHYVEPVLKPRTSAPSSRAIAMAQAIRNRSKQENEG